MTLTSWDQRLGIDANERRIKQLREIHAEIWSSRKGQDRKAAFWYWHGRYCDRCGWHPGAWLFRWRELNVHHIDYTHPTAEEPNSALRGLCTRCHRYVHDEWYDRYVKGRSYWRRDLWPYDKLERVTDRAIWFGWWRRALRRRP